MDIPQIEETLCTKLHLFQFDNEQYFGGFIQMPPLKFNRYRAKDVEERLSQLIGPAPLFPILGTYELAESYVISGQPMPEEWCVVKAEGKHSLWFEEGELKTYDIGSWEVHWEMKIQPFICLKVQS